MERIESSSSLKREISIGNSLSKTMSGFGGKVHRALPYLMIAPALIILFIFVLYPIGYMIYLSFFEWNLMGDKIPIGIENFKNLFADPSLMQVLGNTFKYMFFTVVLSVGIALVLAEYLKSKTKINAFMQGVVFTPYVVSLVSISFIWMWLMDSDYGFLNYLLELVGLSPVKWLDDPNIALNSIIMVSTWKSIGYNTIIILSAMHAVPKELYEAASLDGSSKIKTYFKITLPMISPSVFFLTIMNIISSFKVFDTISIMTQGGPMNSTNTIVFNLYEHGFRFYKIGYASAMGVVLLVILTVCTVVYFKLLSKKVHYQ